MKRSHSGRAPGDFRDQLIAASLKHGKDAAEAEANAKFPRSIDRGLIEATRYKVYAYTLADISAIN